MLTICIIITLCKLLSLREGSMENSVFIIISTLLGGLAVFIFGMNLMSEGLQKAAGDKMRKILAMLTKNPVMGVIAGALVTAVLQSSSATTVMVIGFVSAGLMKLPQAISVILGANIGTTITAQLIAFDIGSYAWIFGFMGFVFMFFLKKKEKIRDIGQIAFGFGILFVGINTMSAVMKPLAHAQAFADLMVKVSDIPVLGVVLGMIMTVVVQSSSATIAVLQNLASTPMADGVTSLIGLKGAIPIMFGDNIGTTITALLASIGASVNAKRTALAHTIFNIFGTLIFIWFIPQIVGLIRWISPKGAEISVISRQIANSHLLFNLTNTIIFIPLIFVLVKVVIKLIPGEDKEKISGETKFIDDKVIDKPVFAMHLAVKELVEAGGIAKNMIRKAKDAFVKGNLEKVDEIIEEDKVVNELREKIVRYLSKILSSESITEDQKQTVSTLYHVASDVEHIGDYGKNLAEFAREKVKNKYVLSEEALKEVEEYFDFADNMLSETFNCLNTGNKELAQKVFEKEKQIDEKELVLRKKHMKRLETGLCSPVATVLYIDVIHNLERTGDSCNNIAEAVLKGYDFKYKIRTAKKKNISE